MPRKKRFKGEFLTYHVMMRGNERKNIFELDEEKLKILEIIQTMKEKYNFILEAYCIMDNHIHLLIFDNGIDISQIMQSINISYAYYYNHLYNRVGHLFQDRFRSEVVGDELYLVEVSKYIHNNPVKAGLVSFASDYIWSSARFYIQEKEDFSDFVFTDRVINVFKKIKTDSIIDYNQYLNKDVSLLPPKIESVNLKDSDTNLIETIEQAYELIETDFRKVDTSANTLKNVKDIRDSIILKIKRNSRLSLRDIGRAFGLTNSSVCKILKKNLV